MRGWVDWRFIVDFRSYSMVLVGVGRSADDGAG
jgi:hypothetical protein